MNKSNESKELVKIVNKIYKGFIFSVAIALGIAAWFKNPGHLFTAGLIFAFGLNSELISKDDDDIC